MSVTEQECQCSCSDNLFKELEQFIEKLKKDKKGNLKALRTGTAKIKVYAKATGTFNKASRTITVKVTKKTAAKPTTPKPVVKPTTTPKPVQPETKPAEKPEQTEQQADSERYVLYFGRFDAQKGIETLLKVCRALPQIQRFPRAARRSHAWRG